MNNIFTLLTVICAALAVSAQTFVTPVEENWLNTADNITIITTNGDSASGSAKMVSVAGSQIRKIAIKDAAGTKHTYEAAQIKLLKLKLSKFAKAQQMVATATASIENAVNTNYAALTSMGYAIWEQVKKPDGDGSYLLQVLNPWFCDYIRVYNVPKFITVSGGLGKSEFSMPEELLVLKNGATVEITEKKYKKKFFMELFGDCPEMASQIPQKERDWDDFPEHVKLYTDLKLKAETAGK